MRKTNQNKGVCLYSSFKVEILLLYLPTVITENKFKLILFRKKYASFQHSFKFTVATYAHVSLYSIY